ncbi:MAG: hypothetical protein PHR16_07745 [Methylovulum sp.]|nr:hypothetical protein [Methylovulum sp.]
MADTYTVLIPQDPYFVPSGEAIETAKLIYECFHEGNVFMKVLRFRTALLKNRSLPMLALVLRSLLARSAVR